MNTISQLFRMWVEKCPLPKLYRFVKNQIGK